MFPRIFFIFFLILSPSFGSESEGPSETECRPYIEKALQREGVTQESTPPIDDVGEPPQSSETLDGSKEDAASGEEASGSVESLVEPISEVPISDETVETSSAEPSGESVIEDVAQPTSSREENAEGSGEAASTESIEEPGTAPLQSDEPNAVSAEQSSAANDSAEAPIENQVTGNEGESQETTVSAGVEDEIISEETEETVATEQETAAAESIEDSTEVSPETEGAHLESESVAAETIPGEPESTEVPSVEEPISTEAAPSAEEAPSVNEASSAEEAPASSEESNQDEPVTSEENAAQSSETAAQSEESAESPSEGSGEVPAETSTEVDTPAPAASIEESELAPSEPETAPEPTPQDAPTVDADTGPSDSETESSDTQAESSSTDIPVAETEPEALPSEASPEPQTEADPSSEGQQSSVAIEEQSAETAEGGSEPPLPEEDLIMPIEIPSNLRSRDHMSQILGLAPGADEKEKLLAKTEENTLRELKKLYDVAIKPLEILYKYRDLSNRHFGDPEIFSKPLILFMGPWSGGKSTIINYLLENEFKRTALRSGAEPSPAYFNIVMHGEKEEILDGTQLAADWTFSGLQKFGQGLLDRLRGLKLNHPLLQKVNIVEIPGILEIRKQVERLFPFNDACQWFIDRADIIFLVYDPSKLDVGPETEAILDQLKGREMQTRIILNKADQVKPEELMRVQGTLIWNISPLMSSTEPPVMYSTSLWSLPYEVGAPSRLLYAQECGFLRDLREAIDKRVENKIASARRFAVRVRNHAKMVDCYLTTYYNHKSFFGNKKKVSDDIIEHPQNYHIYEGLSTLTNISRYDLPDPDVYKEFFRLNPVYEFQQLSATCTYFRGCPINRLDVAIAYDLPELVGKYKKTVEQLLNSRK